MVRVAFVDVVIIAVTLADPVVSVILGGVVVVPVAFTIEVLVEAMDVALMYVELVEVEL